jgi:hypothetical protein
VPTDAVIVGKRQKPLLRCRRGIQTIGLQVRCQLAGCYEEMRAAMDKAWLERIKLAYVLTSLQHVCDRSVLKRQ